MQNFHNNLQSIGFNTSFITSIQMEPILIDCNLLLTRPLPFYNQYHLWMHKANVWYKVKKSYRILFLYLRYTCNTWYTCTIIHEKPIQIPFIRSGTSTYLFYAQKRFFISQKEQNVFWRKDKKTNSKKSHLSLTVHLPTIVNVK